MQHVHFYKQGTIGPKTISLAWGRMGNNLNELRKAKKMSLRKLGEKAGMDFTVISKIETGTVRLASHHIEKLSNALGCPPEDFVSDDPPLTLREREFLELLNTMSEENSDRILDLARTLQGR